MRLKQIVTLILMMTGIGCVLTGCSGAKDGVEAKNEYWVMAYFRQRYPTRIEIDADGKTIEVPLENPMSVEKLHYAISRDGRHWKALNHNEPVWDQFIRDPDIRLGSDGVWRMVATGGTRELPRRTWGPSCMYASSTDLIHWTVDHYLPLMKDVRDDAGRMVRNMWAPEWFYDEAADDAVVLWSSSFEDAGWKKSQLWCARTKDWEHFGETKLLFDPPYSVIDGHLVKHDGMYYLFHKEEEFSQATGERRGIRVATSKELEGPYTIFEGPLNDGQIAPVITEGPAVIPDPIGDGWLLYYDFCMMDGYGVSMSDDLLHWTIDEDSAFPDDARHGCFFKVSEDVAKRLIEAFPFE